MGSTWIPGYTDALPFFPRNMRIPRALHREFDLQAAGVHGQTGVLYEEAGGDVLTPQRKLGGTRKLTDARTTRPGFRNAPEV